MFGGALVGGTIAKEHLYHLKVKENKALWSEVTVKGEKPLPRYGHTLSYCKPHVILFGGSTGSEVLNETWCINMLEDPFVWKRLSCPGPKPTPRVYHSADICQYGEANRMIIIFGGRDASGKTLNEIWGLRRHNNGSWDWTRPSMQEDNSRPSLGRYQHRSIFFGSLMFNIGGKINEAACDRSINVYDYQVNKWYMAEGIECFRHIAWIYKDSVYIHGGLDNQNRILSNGKIEKRNLIQLFKDYPELKAKIEFFVQNYSQSAMGISDESMGSEIIFGKREASPHLPIVGYNPNNTILNNTDTIAGLKNYNKRHHVPPRVILPGLKAKKPSVVKNIHEKFIQKLLRPKDYINNMNNTFPFTSDEILQVRRQRRLTEAVQRGAGHHRESADSARVRVAHHHLRGHPRTVQGPDALLRLVGDAERGGRVDHRNQ